MFSNKKYEISWKQVEGTVLAEENPSASVQDGNAGAVVYQVEKHREGPEGYPQSISLPQNGTVLTEAGLQDAQLNGVVKAAW